MNENEYYKNFVGPELTVFILAASLGALSYFLLNPALLIVKALLVTLGVISTVSLTNVVKCTVEHISSKRKEKKQQKYFDNQNIKEIEKVVRKNIKEVELRGVMTYTQLKQIDEEKTSKPKQLILTKNNDKKNR